MISVCQGFGTQSVPELGSINFFGRLNSNVQVAALDGQFKARLRILNKLQSDFWIALLLEVGNDTLANQARRFDEMKHLIIVPLHQCTLKAEFGRIDVKDLRFGASVKTVNLSSLDLDQVNSLIKGADDTIVTWKN